MHAFFGWAVESNNNSDHSGQVHLGTWQDTEVALKVWKTEQGVTVSSKVTHSFSDTHLHLTSIFQIIQKEIKVSDGN